MLLLAKYISDLYTANEISKSAISEFYLNVKTRIEPTVFDEINIVNNRILALISELDFEKLFISYTSSDSIFYRFKLKDSPYEFKWEVFLDDEGDCESALHIYNDSVKHKSTYGSVNYIYSVISDILFNEVQNSQDDFEFFDKYDAEAFEYAC